MAAQKKSSNLILEVLSILKRTYPDAKCSLDYDSAWQLLVATVLSAQCTDERVNKVTPSLFKKYPTSKQMAKANREDVEELIRSTGFFRSKANNLISAAKTVESEYSGKVPAELDKLVQIAGVGRKTANVILGNAFGVPGLPVDTHVKRLAYRLGFTKQTDPVKIEHDLMKQLPPQEWTMFSHCLIYHGRSRCFARKPDCKNCELEDICPKLGVETKVQKKRVLKSLVSSLALSFIFLVLLSCSSKQVDLSERNEDEKNELEMTSEINDNFHFAPSPLVSLQDASHYQNNDLRFLPNRHWKLTVGWIPDGNQAFDQARAKIIKKFQYIVRGEKERQKLLEAIAEAGGEESYLRWLEGELQPIGASDIRKNARIESLRNETIVTLVMNSRDSVAVTGELSIPLYFFPDPILRTAKQACSTYDLGVYEGGESVGFEVVLQSRLQSRHKVNELFATRWQKEQQAVREIAWQSWSVGAKKQVSYRTLVEVKTKIPRCPLPPKAYEQLLKIRSFGEAIGLRQMRISWNPSQRVERAQAPVRWPYYVEKKNLVGDNQIIESSGQAFQDSLEWPEERKRSWQCFESIQQWYPPSLSKKIQTYLYSLAGAFQDHVSDKGLRFSFYVLDTMNPLVWNCGQGFFGIHAGIVRELRRGHVLDFLLSIKMAHEALGHKGTLLKNIPRPFFVDFWAILSHNQLPESMIVPRTYTIEEEVAAIGLVHSFFKKIGFSFAEVEDAWQDFVIARSSNLTLTYLPAEHLNLLEALRVTQSQRPSVLESEYHDPILNKTFEQNAVEQTLQSRFQRYGWMSEIIYLVDAKELVDSAQTKKQDEVKKETSKPRTSFELTEGIEDTLANPLARYYLKAKRALEEKEYRTAAMYAQKALASNSTLEPFLWQDAVAQQQLGEYGNCLRQTLTKWKGFDDVKLLLHGQCLFLDGKITAALAQFKKRQQQYPGDAWGWFWELLTQIRLRTITRGKLDAVEKLWGDRPMFRALDALYYSHLKKPSAVKAALQLDMNDKYYKQYDAEEWAVLGFARDWVKASWGPEFLLEKKKEEEVKPQEKTDKMSNSQENKVVSEDKETNGNQANLTQKTLGPNFPHWRFSENLSKVLPTSSLTGYGD